MSTVGKWETGLRKPRGLSLRALDRLTKLLRRRVTKQLMPVMGYGTAIKLVRTQLKRRLIASWGSNAQQTQAQSGFQPIQN